MTKLREIKFVATKQFTLNVAKDTFVNYITDSGEVLTKTTPLIKPDPRGNWKFVKVKPGVYEYTFKETESWVNLTPTADNVSEKMKFQNPMVTNKLGPNVPYVTIEEALYALVKSIRRCFNSNELKVVATPENAEAIKAVVDAPDGFPIGAVLDRQYLDPTYIEREKQKEIEKVQNIEKDLIARLISDPKAAKEIFDKAQGLEDSKAEKPKDETSKEIEKEDETVKEEKPEEVKEESETKTTGKKTTKAK